MSKLIFVVGATASGKSQVGVQLAKKFNGEILSCDSMQIFKGMDIGTAKITPQEMQGIRHHMIDLVSPKDRFSVGEYVKIADGIIKSILESGKTPIVVGGTGLYVDGLLYPMSFGGDRDDVIREQLEKELAEYGSEYMYNKLVEIDPQDAKKIHPNNVKRVLRALEIYRVTGICKSELQEQDKDTKYEPCMVTLELNRELLYQRIEERVDKMINMGLQSEVEGLLQQGVDFDCQSMQAIGYKEFREFFDGKATLKETAEAIKQNSRNYAKRQITWFRKYQFAKRFEPSDVSNIEKYVELFLKGEYV